MRDLPQDRIFRTTGTKEIAAVLPIERLRTNLHLTDGCQHDEPFVYTDG